METETLVGLSVRISSDAWKRLKEMADAEKRTVSNYVRIVLEQHVEKLAKARK